MVSNVQTYSVSGCFVLRAEKKMTGVATQLASMFMSLLLLFPCLHAVVACSLVILQINYLPLKKLQVTYLDG